MAELTIRQGDVLKAKKYTAGFNPAERKKESRGSDAPRTGQRRNALIEIARTGHHMPAYNAGEMNGEITGI